MGLFTPQSPPKQPPASMSSSSTPTGTHAASVKKIANYTQSISTGVTNLLNEIGRVSASSAPAPASTSGTDAAILFQLQALTGQIVGLVNWMDEVQRMVGGLEKRLDDMGASPPDIRWELTNENHIHISEKHNALAQLHNGHAREGSSILLPLHNPHDRPILGFPATVSHLVHLDEYVRENLCKAFGLEGDRHDSLEEFIGVGAETIKSVTLYGLPAEKLALDRIKRASEREAACEAAGPATVKTREDAKTHNTKARAHNNESFGGPIIPIHDSRNIPVTGFPVTFDSLTSPGHQADILYFLGEYKQDVDPEDALTRWYEFVGVDTDRAWADTEYESYTWLD